MCKCNVKVIVEQGVSQTCLKQYFQIFDNRKTANVMFVHEILKVESLLCTFRVSLVTKMHLVYLWNNFPPHKTFVILEIYFLNAHVQL